MIILENTYISNLILEYKTKDKLYDYFENILELRKIDIQALMYLDLCLQKQVRKMRRN